MFTKEENDKKIFVNFRFMLFVALSLATGILFSYFLFMGKYVYAIAFALVFIVLCVWYYLFNFRRSTVVLKTVFFVIFVLTFLVGAVSFSIQTNDYKNASLGNGYYTVTAKVYKTEKTDSGLRLELNDVKLNNGESAGYNVELRVYGDCFYDLGDVIEFSCRLKDKEPIYEDRFLSNDVVDGLKYTAFVYSDGISLKEQSPNVFQKINVLIRDTLKAGMSENSFAISYALLTGGSENIADDVISVFRNTGVAHIFAVSGLHIGFLAVVLNFIFKKIPVNANVKTVITSFILFFYSGVCGFSASSVRACIMATVTLIASIGGLKYDGLTSVSIAGIIILVISPAQLLCVGFQLSFTVVIGILAVSPWLTRVFKFLPEKLASSLATVISAQLFGIPILLYAFSRFSVVSIIVNLLFIPVVGVVFIGLIALTVIGAVFSIPAVTLFVPDYVIKILTFLINFFDKEFFIVGGFSLGVFAVLYYLTVIVASGFFNLKRLTATVVCAVLLTACVLGTTLKSFCNEGVRVIVSGSDDFCFTVISEEEKGVLVINDLSNGFSVSRLQRIKTTGQVTELQAIVFTNVYKLNDLALAVVRILNVYEAPFVYYYGEKDTLSESVVTHSFSNVAMLNFFDEQIIKTQDFVLSGRLQGYAVTTELNGKNIAMFSRFSEVDAEYHGLKEKFDLLISVNYTDILSAMYCTGETVSYLYHTDYLNAESRGNLKYYL